VDAPAASIDEYLARLSGPDQDALIYFGAAKKHLAIYGTSAGTKHFTAAEPLTAEYITGLVHERVAEIDARLASRKRARA
jgi:uncharacterized protein YdhG (YjbR/CyaY superfamily)